MAERMRQLTTDTERIRADYERAEVVGVSPGGTVRVTMRAGRIIALVIDPVAMDHDNVYVAGQVLSAIKQAEDQSNEFLTARTTPMAGAVEELRNRLR